MKKTAILVLALASVGAFAQVQATNYYVVEDSGTYQDNTSTFFDLGAYYPSATSGPYKSFGGLDFDGSAYAGETVTTAVLALTDQDYIKSNGHGAVGGTFTVWAVTDNTTSLAKGQTAIAYDDGVTGGYNGQLGTATSLGSFVYAPGSTNAATSGTVYSVNLTNLSAISALAATASHNVRLVITGDDTGYATFWGNNNTGGYNQPTLTVRAQAVPEPASLAVLGLGLVSLVARRRRSSK